jgi:GT2 family glycosyltransferase
MDPKVVIVSCTEKHPENASEVLLFQSFHSGGMDGFATLDMVWGNSEGLSTAYNRKIAQYAGSGVDFLVFVHDDVYLDDLKFADKLQKAHSILGFQIIGVAGAAALDIEFPTLWHLMAKKEHRRGFVHHSIGGMQTEATNFGPTPAEVIILDGVFMAIHLPSIVAAGWRFNENYRFHHYDIASCLEAFKLGLKMGVFPIHLIHLSQGLSSFSDKLWRESNDVFLAEYGPKDEPK